MTTVSRRVAVTSAATAVVATGAGLWLQETGRRDLPAGFVQYALVAAGASVLGAFILWHRPRNRYGVTHLAIGVLFAAVVLAAAVLARADGLPGWAAETALAWSWLATAPLLPLWVIAIAAFPDGRFHRPGVRRATVALALLMSVLAVLGYLLAPPGEPPPLIRVAVPAALAGPLAGWGEALFRGAAMSGAVLGALAPVGAIGALAHRFHHEVPVVRQQIKWLLAGGAISVALQAIPVHAFDSEVLRSLAQGLVLLAVPLPMLAAALAIFRYGLWEIDVVISKGVVYTLASGVLTVLFLGIALVAGLSVGGRDGRVVGALGLALLVSFLAQPLRQRLEKLVAKLLYGDEPRGLVGLARLEDAVGDSPDAAGLGARITAIVMKSLAAGWCRVWLYLPGWRSGGFRTIASSGREAGPSVFLPEGIADKLARLSGGHLITDLDAESALALHPLVSDPAAMVAPLTAGGELVGLIACGAPTQPFGDGDLDLLTIIARESALALRNLRLEGELRQRLDQIEVQAAELHRSRQRLVAAQDEERRRIERDLHDGAQQQLVALAGHLRRASRASDPIANAELERLADEAEEAVFSLQELARGIYPSLLSDRGLEAALQAHAARLPLDIRIDVGPATKGRRLSSELEAAFYFVALEAMTNVVKHAPAAAMIVSLWADPTERRVTLEVHDDGPGFDPAAASGSGLQNMADRIGAVGGTLVVESRPGAGTWIRAEAPEEADVTDVRSRRATP